MARVEEQLKKLGITLPTPPAPAGSYVPAQRTGNLVFLSAAGPRTAQGGMLVGKVGRDVTLQQAQDAARTTALNLLANLKAAIGDLDKVRRIVKVVGVVSSESDFTDHPKVINGCSDLLLAVFGERGRHARAAWGVNALPFGSVVSIEMIVEVED